MNIFTPSQSLSCELPDLFDTTNQSRVKFDLVYDLNLILDEPCKICLVEHWTYDPEKIIREWLEEYQNLDFSIFDLVIIVDFFCWHNTKLIQTVVQANKIKNYLLLTEDSRSIHTDEAIFYPHFLLHVLRFNEFKESNHYAEKPFLFDALLGSPKPHRSYVMKRFQNNEKLLDQSVVTYRDIFRTDEKNSNYYKWSCQSLTKLGIEIRTGEIWFPYTSAGHQLIGKYDTPVSNFIVAPSSMQHTVPWEIYNNTWYSIITETEVDLISVTEKIGKVFFAKRVFILFGAVGSLALLKKLGFKTFDCVIDETYDTVQDHVLRWKMAFDQVEKLAELDPRKIYDQTEEIREHNFNRLREYFLETQNKVQNRLWLHITYGQHAIRMMHALNNDA